MQTLNKAGSSASLEDVRANNHHLRWHKAQLAFGILFLALWLCAVIALCVRWARTEERASKICRDKPKFQFRGYQDDYAHCDAGFVCVHGSIDSGGNIFAGIGSGGNLPFCESSDSKLCSDPEAELHALTKNLSQAESSPASASRRPMCSTAACAHMVTKPVAECNRLIRTIAR